MNKDWAAARRAWAKENPERMKKLQADWEKAHTVDRKAYKAQYYQAHKEKIAKDTRRNKLKRKYDMTPEQFTDMKTAQSSKCAICDKTRPLCIDHCHKSGKVRGLLCHNCNTALGHFEDNAATLVKVSRYLNGV